MHRGSLSIDRGINAIYRFIRFFLLYCNFLPTGSREEPYNLIKPQIHQMLIDVHAGEEVIYRLHLESLYFMLAYLRSHFDDKNLQQTYDLITEINSLPYIQLAKKYVNDDMDEKRQFDELMFLASDFTPEEFFERFKLNDSSNNEPITKRIMKRLLK